MSAEFTALQTAVDALVLQAQQVQVAAATASTKVENTAAVVVLTTKIGTVKTALTAALASLGSGTPPVVP